MRDLLFHMPKPSPTFDCDDSALLMSQRLSRLGIKSTPILGNLKMDGETFYESDHVWILVDVAGLRIAFDWGTPQFDRQHYEGYTLTSKQLLTFVQQDFVIPEKIPALSP